MYLHTQKHLSSFSLQPLYGHTDAVTCLAVSEVHSLIVSGSRDLTCILWDMEELSYITQLAGHTTAVSALAINELTVSPPSRTLAFDSPLKIALLVLPGAQLVERALHVQGLCPRCCDHVFDSNQWLSLHAIRSLSPAFPVQFFCCLINIGTISPPIAFFIFSSCAFWLSVAM